MQEEAAPGQTAYHGGPTLTLSQTFLSLTLAIRVGRAWRQPGPQPHPQELE